MPKAKISQAERRKQALKEHEDWLKSMGYQGGKSLKGKYGRRIGIYSIPDYSTGPRVTSDTVCSNGNKRESVKYTGTYLQGIATMHKSNAIPVSSREQAIEVSQMRRG